MAARILNFILRYGFLNEEKQSSVIYTQASKQAQKLYDSFAGMNLSTNMPSYFSKNGDSQ